MGNKLDKLRLLEKGLTRDTLDKFYNISVGDYSIHIQGRYTSTLLTDVNESFDLTGNDWSVDDDNGYISCRLEDKMSSMELGNVIVEITLT